MSTYTKLFTGSMLKVSLYLLALLSSLNGFCTDVYNPVNQQLTIPSVYVNESIYTNVVVTLGSVVSVGGQINPRTTINFPVLQAIKNLYLNGTSPKQFQISGNLLDIAANGSTNLTSLSGAASLYYLPQTSTTFKGASAISVQFNETIINFYQTYLGTKFVPPNSTGSGNDIFYLNTNYQPIGYQYYQGNYCETITPGNYPTTAIIGQSGLIANYNCWTNSTKKTLDSIIIESYETSSDSKGNMIFKIIRNFYFSGNNQFTSQQTLTLNISTTGLANISSWSTNDIPFQYSCASYPGISCSFSEIVLN